jgi:DNA-binding PadR family transcriptional regulator
MGSSPEKAEMNSFGWQSAQELSAFTAIIKCLAAWEPQTGPSLVARLRHLIEKTQAYQHLRNLVLTGLVDKTREEVDGRSVFVYALSEKGWNSLNPFGVTVSEVLPYEDKKILAIQAVFDSPARPATFYQYRKAPVKHQPNRFVLEEVRRREEEASATGPVA